MRKVKVNFDPFSTSLSTQISPPFLSTNSLQSTNPSPVPFSPMVPSFEFDLSKLNISVNFSDAIPMPVS